MDVGVWLRSLGLEQYDAAFRENAIDSEILSKLTAEDLRELGVVSVGHRRKLLTAIGELSGSSGSPAVFAKPQPAAAPVEAAERRQLTVMFCDLVGSTALSARLDPEDMGDLIRAFQGVVASAVTRFGGHVAKLMGDGALVYFGYPRAHEDDAERAARAGLCIVEAVGALRRERGIALEVRAGIATGLVVVGELMGEGEARERGVVGDTPNLAARLQALAEPGTVVVAESTRRLLGRAFDLEALGPQALKGFAAPVSAWVVVREAENVSRFEASRSGAMTPFVGREQEVALLGDRWRDANEGEGQVVLLSGEAGIGKSRILATLRERIGSERHVAIRYQCSPHHVNDAFYPVIGQIWRAAGLVTDEPAATRLDKVEAMVALSGLDAKEIAPYLASLVSIPFGDRYPALDMAPSELKERTMAALIALFVGLTKETTVLALLEDSHWIDPTSLDLFGRLVERLQGLRALLVVTFRPEFVAPWVGRGHVTAHALNRFGRRQVLTMIDRVTGGKALPTDVLDEIVSKTDGVPLFIEELTKTVLESGLVRDAGGAYVLAAALTPLAIPPTLQDTLMARLDRLAPVKEIAQIGAAIGRQFSYRLLEAVSPIAGPALQDALDQLVASELIYGRGAPPEATYVFKHALVQDAAYASLLRGRRQRIHADIARALAERFADAAETSPAIIAHHYTEAGLAEPAARYWLAAAGLALSRSAPIEADRYADAGLAQMPRLAEGPDRDAIELPLHVAHANALTLSKGITAAENFAAFTAAKRLLDTGVGTDLQRLTVFYGLWGANFFRARIEPARAYAQQIVDVADRQDDTTYRIVGYRVLATTQLAMGQNLEGLESLREAERHRDPIRDRRLSYHFTVDPGLTVLGYQVAALSMLGRFDQAAKVREQMRAEFSSHAHAPTVAFYILHSVVAPEFYCDLEDCERRSAELVAYCAEKRLEPWRLAGALYQGCARATREPTPENIAALRETIDACRRSDSRLGKSFFDSQLAEAQLGVGDVRGAEATLQEIFAFVEESGERYWLSNLHRIEGGIALARPEPDRAMAEACLLQAIDVARQQNARMHELRAAIDLARLWRDTGSNNDPRALLEQILAAIEGGEAMRHVREARALLAQLA